MRAATSAVLLGLLSLGCRDEILGDGSQVITPTNLSYAVEPSGIPGSPSGVLLHWDSSNDPAIAVWNVYSRGSTADSYELRGSTTSNTYHDNGIPHLQYYVTAEDDAGFESSPSNAVTIDERLALDKPTALTTTTLDGAIALSWTDNAFTTDPQGFSIYRVYSTGYDLDQGLCGATWFLEGTTVAPEFIAGVLPNGVPRCFGVSAISVEGFESLWSPIRSDTPRPDARNIVLKARQYSVPGSGFRFWRDFDGDGLSDPNEIGLVSSGDAPDIDFSLELDDAGNLLLTPVRAGTGVIVYGSGPVEDLTSIDFAPNVNYPSSPLSAEPGFGYVFEMDGGDGLVRYGAVRVTHVGQHYLILDWAFQTDPGNPELVRPR